MSNDEKITQARNEGVAAGTKQERARAFEILHCEEAAGAERLATALVKAGVDPAAAKTILLSAPASAMGQANRAVDLILSAAQRDAR